MLASRAATIIDQAALAGLRIDLYTMTNRIDRAGEVCLGYLRCLGIEWSAHPTADEARREYERIWWLLGGRETEALVDLPIMSEPEALATMDVLTKVTIAAMNMDVNLYGLVICRMVNLSLEHGNTDASCVAYVCVGAIAGLIFGNYKAGFRFGRLGYDLVERRGLKRFQARTYLDFVVLIIPWTKHLRTERNLFRRAFDAANSVGDLTYGTYACLNLNHRLLAIGDPLPDVQREAEQGLEFTQKARFGPIIDVIATQLALIRNLRGFTVSFGCFNDEHFDELEFEGRLSAPIVACWYWIRKLQARFFAGDYAAAADAWLHAQELLWTSPSFFEAAEARFYGALSHAASCDSADPVQYRQDVEALTGHHKQLVEWAENCPENFENRAALVGAEIARIEGRVLEAEHLYEQAIRSAHSNGFVNNEAIAYELAARFYAARGFEKIANGYLREARYGYLRWGADGKVRQLDSLYPQLKGEAPSLVPTSTIRTPVEQLDLATVIKVSQAVSGEVVLEKLIDTLMSTAIEQAGAERGLLILLEGIEHHIAAEAATSGDSVVVRLPGMPAANTAVPDSKVHYVARTHESVILDDASAQHPFSADAYFQQQPARSILCLPLINQAKLIGLLYLENNLAPHIFTPTRLTVLKLLASQAAISLENTRLYRDLEEREGALRETQAELAHVSRVTTMGELAASIAHEVNQPLVGVVMNASASLRLLDRKSPDLVETREAIRAIIRDGNRTADVVSRMRALFKKARPAKEQLNINEAIEEVVILTRGEARRNKVALRMELAANLPLIMADRVQVQQVVMNLILNGIEAMRAVEDRERDLLIKTQRSVEDRLLVAVQDSGIGLDPENVERIFDAFHTTKPGGMGMGLSISRSIVENHGGRLWAIPNDGPGATFQFTL